MSEDNNSIRELLEKSNDVRRGEALDSGKAFAIARQLADAQYIEHARRLAAHIATDERLDAALAVELRQKWALWTSQNPDGPDDSKHDEALHILDGIRNIEGGASLKTTTDGETLGIAGGICKRKWAVTGQRQCLEDSLRYYERGAGQGIEADNGYTAINAAFILDLLASLAGDDEEDAKRTRARAWREQVRDTLLRVQDEPAWDEGPPRKEIRWFHETLAEAYFGLGDCDKATESLQNAYRLSEPPKPWQLETTARQFAHLARLQDPDAKTSEDFEKSAAWGVLRAVYGDSATAGAGSLFAGKLGLGLSGGGFRASLFHIGVLAGLAERDLLRHVEALSCVSGGSILGAHYYLEVRRLLQEKSDAEITRDDYIALVERLARDFLEGVQDNIRTRVGNSLLSNLRMMFQPGYTRTNRLGELYERHLYARVEDDGERVLRKLIVKPKGDEGCNPKYDNWKRSNKVPILILNATTVNTGHNWQFTASWMGEPPAFIDSEIDGNYRLRRMYYDTEAPSQHRDIHIGQAAAASSCVPGLFTPLELRDLYQDVTIRLVDGGVHDNQGIAGLLDQNCTVLLVSDASGQMSTIDRPPDDPLGVLLRTTGILQARVRTSEYREVESRRKSGRLKGLLFLHLKKGLEVEDRDWIGCDNPKQLTDEELRRRRGPLLSYGILKGFQGKIANIRTDLDSFSEAEAFALMTSGCEMVRAGIGDAIEGFQADEREHDWSFLGIKPVLRSTKEETSDWLDRLLDVSPVTFLKIWKLSPLLRAIGSVAGVAAALVLLYGLVAWRGEAFLSLKGLAAALAMMLLTAALGSIGLKWLARLINYRKTVWQVLVGAGLSLVGWIGTNLHLKFFDRWFLARGRMRDLQRDET